MTVQSQVTAHRRGISLSAGPGGLYAAQSAAKVQLKVQPTVQLKVQPKVQLKVQPKVQPKVRLKVQPLVPKLVGAPNFARCISVPCVKSNVTRFRLSGTFVFGLSGTATGFLKGRVSDTKLKAMGGVSSSGEPSLNTSSVEA